MRARRSLSWMLCLAATAGLWAVPRTSPFHPPLSGSLALVASFGEYRPDHLHPGVDLSTGGRTGLPVLAVADGQIYRLKVEWRGYGRALYLRHPDGRISVYAHLERFEESALKLESRVDQARRTTGLRYPGDIYLDPPVPVKRGQRIAASGESGAGLPHLHFELRRDDQRPGNPLVALGPLHGGPAPRIEALILVSRGAEALVRGERSAEIGLSRDADGTFVPAVVPVVTGPFLPEARIVQDDALGHRTGIRGLSVVLDGIVVYRYSLDEFRFDEYPQVGLLLDSTRSSLSPAVFTYRLARLPGNELGRLGPPVEAPWPELKAGRHLLELEVTGALGEPARAKIPFIAIPPPSLKWEEVGPGSAAMKRLALRIKEPERLAPGKWRLVYTTLGSRSPLNCERREELPDGEACDFRLDSLERGITTTLILDGDPVARKTRLLPASADPPATPPVVEADPGMAYMDLRIAISPGDQNLPSRVVLKGEAGEARLDLVEEQPGVLIASVPWEIWVRSSGVDLEWDGPPRPLRVASPLKIHEGTPGRASKLEDCGLRLELPADSLFEPTAVACSDFTPAQAMPQGLVARSSVTRILPSGTPLAHKALLTFPAHPDAGRSRRLGIYRLDEPGGQWAFLGGNASEDGISVSIGKFDTFALLEDSAPPRILGIEPPLQSGWLESRPRFVIRAEDVGTGLNYDGVHLQLDGREVEMDFDPDRGRSSGSPAIPLSRGSHTLRLWAEDRAGNRSPDEVYAVRVR